MTATEIRPEQRGAAEQPHTTGPAEVVGYGLAGLVLVGGGALWTTPVLNWLVGPAICVLCVAAAGFVGDRVRGGSDA
ncbi:hypothetical protein [Streptomyces millisiae]|uniref:Uncharacterized protein n=1 Tax=Streptomyces millisiae TaxID=3075542 RepID=A0ABU2LXZ5_9ACTN|nr:hypothetical protein [Streptomyces sp. DSM 44918]MDT0322459.1 hypothetical protein [Streptomyces sp. DSM 44918]